jgi:hypothetical protein
MPVSELYLADCWMCVCEWGVAVCWMYVCRLMGCSSLLDCVSVNGMQQFTGLCVG